MSWQDRVLSDVRAIPDSRHDRPTKFGIHQKPLQFSCTIAFVRYIAAAAQRMNMNRSTYIRRVLAVHAAHVLGIDVRTILRESPVPREWDAKTIPPPLMARDASDVGDGIEAWCPHPGCTGEHLKPGLP